MKLWALLTKIDNKKLFYGILLVVLVIVGTILFIYLNKPTKTIKQVMEQHVDELMAIEGVVGVGIGECDGMPCIRVYLEKETQESKNIPKQLEGFKVDLQVTGPIEALPK